MKKKIAFISEHASPLAALGGVDAGGQNIAVGELAQQLTDLGYEIDIFTRREDSRFPKTVAWRHGVRVVHITAGPVTYVPKEDLLPHMDAFTTGMLKFMEQEQLSYKLIHAHFWMSALVAADIKKRLGIPFVVTFHALGKIRKLHQGQDDRFPEVRSDVEERVVREADQVVALCPQERDDLMEHYGADPDKITIVPNGYNTSHFYPVDQLLARMVLGLDQRERIILQLGRMVPRKGVSTIISSLKYLKQTYKKTARLLVVGGESDEPDPEATPEIGRLLEHARREGVKDQVTFVGRRDREALRYYYSASDVFVTTPWYEPFGITPLESMACGTPVIGSDVGGIKYTIQDGSNGFLVPPKDPKVLAKRLDDVLSSRQLMTYFSENGLQRVRATFTWEKVANQTSALYEKVILDSPRRVEGEQDSLTLIDAAFDRLVHTAKRSKKDLRVGVLDAGLALSRVLAQNGKVLVCGNGGSAAQAQHFSTELMGQFESQGRRPLAAISLTADTMLLTAWSNDYHFTDVFARQVKGLGQPGDILLCLTTSGKSENVVEAIKAARPLGMFTIVLSGKTGGPAAELADIALVVPSAETTAIQEMHINMLHTMCMVVEQKINEENRESVRAKRSAVKELESFVLRQKQP